MKRSKELKIGIFAVVVLVVSFFVINYLRGADVFGKEIELTSRYDNVEGLVASAPVYIKGYKAGKVAAVEYDSEAGNFKVTCSIQKEFRIPADSKMTIYSVDIMGGKGIRIDLGSADEAVSNGDSLEPSIAPDLIGGLTESLGPLLKKVGDTIDSLEVTVSGVNSILSAKNRESISRTLADLEKTMANVRGVASSVDGKSQQLEDFIDNLASLSVQLGGIAEKVDTTMVGVSGVVDSLNESDIKGLVTSFKGLVDSMNNPTGTVGKLLVDDSVYNSVDSLLNHVDTLVRKIQENPKKYIKISVF